jgi:hypothetical protein
VLIGNLASHLHAVPLPAGFSAADATPALLAHLPPAVHQGFVTGYAESIQTVFLVAVPVAALAFLATWLIPQVELVKWPEADQLIARHAEAGQAVHERWQAASGRADQSSVSAGPSASPRAGGQPDTG